MGGGRDVHERRDRPLTAAAFPLALLLQGPPAEAPPLGVVAFYGLRATSEEAARGALGLSSGDVLSSDKVAASVDLVEATEDTASEVRNNALRALGVMASAPGIWPGGHFPIPAEPLVELLRSPVWTDRNKASFLLEELTEGREPSLLRLLSGRAFDELVEMARWPVMGHAYSSLVMLGRIAGLPEEQIARAVAATDREALIAAATKARGAPPGR